MLSDFMMDKVPESEIDKSIDLVIMRLLPSSGVHNLYPNQRKMLHNFCKGENIFYTGKIVPLF
jgi:hypothetical protein